MKVNMHWATNPSWARAIMTLLPWWLSFKLSWQSCKTTKTTKIDIWHSISTTFLDSPQVWTKLVSVPDPKPTPAQIAFSILKAIYVSDDETRMKTALGLGTVVLSPDPTYKRESGDIRLIPLALRWSFSGEKLLSANHTAENTICRATLEVLGQWHSTFFDT